MAWNKRVRSSAVLCLRTSTPASGGRVLMYWGGSPEYPTAPPLFRTNGVGLSFAHLPFDTAVCYVPGSHPEISRQVSPGHSTRLHSYLPLSSLLDRRHHPGHDSDNVQRSPDSHATVAAHTLRLLILSSVLLLLISCFGDHRYGLSNSVYPHGY